MGSRPRAGQLLLTDTGLVCRATDGEIVQTSPRVGPVRSRHGRSWRATTVDLAYVAEAGPHPVYLIRVEGSVFATLLDG